MNKKNKFNPQARHRTRRLLLQALYQWQLAGQPVAEIAAQFAQDENMVKADGDYFQELLQAIPAQSQALDQQFQSFLDRSVNELDPIELAILRLGTFELTQRLEIPYRVVINEAVELAKTFGAEEGHKYVNGILDRVAHQVRAAEIKTT